MTPPAVPPADAGGDAVSAAAIPGPTRPLPDAAPSVPKIERLPWHALVEQGGELLRREDPVAVGHELADLLPVRVVGEQHTDAVTAASRGEEGVARSEE